MHTDSSFEAQVFEELNRSGVRYCHWKSNAHLDRSMSGKTDFDLLVDRRDIYRFKSVLSHHKFLRVESPAVKRYPGMEDLLGFNPQTGCRSYTYQ